MPPFTPGEFGMYMPSKGMGVKCFYGTGQCFYGTGPISVAIPARGMPGGRNTSLGGGNVLFSEAFPDGTRRGSEPRTGRDLRLQLRHRRVPIKFWALAPEASGPKDPVPSPGHLSDLKVRPPIRRTGRLTLSGAIVGAGGAGAETRRFPAPTRATRGARARRRPHGIGAESGAGRSHVSRP